MPTSLQHFHETRATSRYRDGWASLDQWNPISPFALRLTAGIITRDDTDGDWWRTKRVARLPAGVSFASAEKAIRDTMGGSSCRHEHDCCGCVHRHVDVHRISRRQVSIVTTYSRNL